MSRRSILPALSSSRQMMMAWNVSGLSRETGDHGLSAGFDALGDSDLALARKQLDRAHVTEIDPHGVGGALGGFLEPGLDRNRTLPNFDQLGITVGFLLGILWVATASLDQPPWFRPH